MARILVLYSTIDGQTRRIAERVAEVLMRDGHAVNVRAVDAASVPRELGEHDAVVLGAAIRYGHFQRRVGDLVRRCKRELDARPNAFFSVCLTAGGPGARPDVALGYVREFFAKTGWHPRETQLFAGALLYTRYNPFVRFMMRLIVGLAGGDTDASRDYEYTDWRAVERFASSFSTRMHHAAVAAWPSQAARPPGQAGSREPGSPRG